MLSKKVMVILLVMSFVMSSFPWVVYAEGDTITVTIIHVNDRHGRMDVDAYIAQLEVMGHVLILDAGDTLHGQTTTNLTQGKAMVNVMNTVGYSAMAPGNHDFNFGVERLLALSEKMDFPLLSANVMKDGKNVFKSYEIFDFDVVKVGVFGLTTPETVSKADPRIVADLAFEDPLQVGTEMAAILKNEGCDMIIALTHMGMDELDEIFAIPGVDVLIDGHSHTPLENGLIAGDMLIAQTGEHGKNIGIVEITKTNDGINKTAYLIAVDDNLAADEKIREIIEDAQAQIEPMSGMVVGYTPVKLEGERGLVRTSETNLANIITDSMRFATGADIAFMTGGNIRASIEAGDITMGDVLTVLPFSNLLVSVEMTGADVLGVLEHGVSEYPEEAGQHIQVSGLSFTFNPDADPGERVNEVRINNAVLDKNKTYTAATVEFLAAGGDGYTMLLNSKNLVYYGGDVEALTDYLVTAPVMNAEAEGRVSVSNAASVINPTPEPESAAVSSPMDDVQYGDWYYAAVYYLIESDLLPHTVTFNPHMPVDSYEMLALIKTSLPNSENITDISGALTREKLAFMLMEGYSGHALDIVNENPDFKDASSVDEKYAAAVEFAYMTGMMQGVTGSRFDPKGMVTRAQVAVLVWNIMNAM